MKKRKNYPALGMAVIIGGAIFEQILEYIGVPGFAAMATMFIIVLPIVSKIIKKSSERW